MAVHSSGATRAGTAPGPAATLSGALALDPRSAPAVLATATWDPRAAWAAIGGPGGDWLASRDDIIAGRPPAPRPGVAILPAAIAVRDASALAVVALADGQRAIVAVGRRGGGAPCGEPFGQVELAPGVWLLAYAASDDAIAAYCREFAPRNAPRAWGATPRLGIGVRMTTAVWPGAFAAMERGGFAANTIQNSVRELNLLADLVAGAPAPRNYACGFGTIEGGYTGSTFEGLWLEGVLAAFAHPGALRYGADADHLQVKRADAGLVSARRTLAAARHYTFFTIDASDVLDYAALDPAVDAGPRFAAAVADASERRSLLAHHRAGGIAEPEAARYAAKYAAALDALAAMAGTIAGRKLGEAFDLELSIDEHPPEVPAFACLTGAQELAFVLGESRRRGIPLTHVAPNLGIEKGFDYRHPSGLDGLGRRARALHQLAEADGVMLDIHSADDLGPGARRALRAATGGRLHYKISPSLQLLYAQVLRDHRPGLYARWRDDALAYARREAAAGSAFAARCLEGADDDESPAQAAFHHFGFAFVGRRDADGAFVHRHEFYALPEAFLRDYAARVAERLTGLAADLF